MSFALYQEQAQKLMMTTQMKQAMKVLQLSAMELDTYIAEQVGANPLLEYDPIDRRMLQTHPAQSTDGRRSTHSRLTGADGSPLEQLVGNDVTLTDILEDQLRYARAPQDVRRIAMKLVGCLNESGYLLDSIDTIAQWLGAPIATVGAAVTLLQSCDPLGIAARNLQECLILQISAISPQWRELVRQLIDGCLEDVAAGRVRQIARHLKTSPTEVQQAIDALRTLNPRPGLGYRVEPPSYIIPEIIVEVHNGSLSVLTNDRSEPSVTICRGYWDLARKNRGDAEVHQYLRHKLQAAKWLVHCLDQRRVTLHRVASAIIEAQEAYFLHGQAALSPLTMKQIANALALHESTVSRSVHGKYIQSPQGLQTLKSLFSAELHTTNGATSADVAKFHIRKCLDEENPGQPLSDGSIMEKLAGKGILLSRRTVAKYREEMGVPSSQRRKRFAEPL